MISAIIPTYNSACPLDGLLSSLSEVSARHELEVIIVDHGSSDKTAGIAAEYAGRIFIRYMPLGGSYTLASSLNLGAGIAQSPRLIFISPEIPGSSQLLLDAAARIPGIKKGIVVAGGPPRSRAGPNSLVSRPLDEILSENGGRDGSPFSEQHLIFNRGLMVCRKQDFEISGGFTGEYEKHPDKTNPHKILVSHLWGAHPEPAFRELERIYRSDRYYGDKQRIFAAYSAGVRLFSRGKFDDVFELLHFMETINPDVILNKKFVTLFLFCSLKKNMLDAARNCLERYLERFPLDTAVTLLLSNTHVSDDAMRLNLINYVYRVNGFCGIQKIDGKKALSFGNISCRVLECHPEGRPKVSVVMPVYNAESTIETAIDSVLDQTWKNLEIIVVDDNSSDTTFDRVLSMAERDGRIKAVRQPENFGAYAARNRGLEEAAGEFVTTHDADDWSHPQKIEAQAMHLEENPAAMGTLTYWARISGDLRFTPSWRVREDIVHCNRSSFLFRKNVVDDLGPWDNVRVSADTEYIKRVEKYYPQDAVVELHREVPLAFALDDGSSLTRNSATHGKTANFGLRKQYHSIFNWWHDHSSALKMDKNSRPFPVPKPMLSGDNEPLSLDTLYVSDFSAMGPNEQVFESLKQEKAGPGKAGFFHWPRFSVEKRSFPDGYFNALASGAEPVVSGQVIDAEKIVLLDARAVRDMVAEGPQFAKEPAGYIIAESPGADRPEDRNMALDQLKEFVRRNLARTG